MKEYELARLITSRICHDLASPIGAILNGMELLELSGQTQTIEMDLISQSVNAANARLKYLRIAFGSTGNQDEICTTDVTHLLHQVYNQSRIKLNCNLAGNTTQKQAKMICLFTLCLENLLPGGGDIAVIQSNEGWSFRATGAKLACAPEQIDAITGQSEIGPASPAQIHFTLLNELIRSEGISVTPELRANRVLFVLS